MPAEQKPRIYWDSCVVLSYLEGTPDRIADLDELILKQQAGDIEIVTSVVARAEIVYVAGMEDEESEKAIEQLWLPGSPITPVEVFDQITADAQRLIRHQRTNGWKKLTPLDAIHVASAARYADEMQTYDEDLHQYASTTGIRISNPIVAQPTLPPADSSAPASLEGEASP